MKVGIKEVKADSIELEEIAGRIEDVYKAAECMFEYSFIKEYFDNSKYDSEFYKDKARIQYYILGDEIIAMGDALMELRNYIGGLTNGKRHSGTHD